MTIEKQRLVLVTGGNRGIGFEVCRQLGRLGYRVILTARDPVKGQAAARVLVEEGLPVVFHPLDVTSEESIADLRHFIVHKFHRLDVLINNAAVFLKGEDGSVMSLSLDTLRRTLETNTFAVLRMCQVFLSLMKKRGYGRVVNVSSDMGQHANIHNMSAAYRLSKDALNALTQMIADSIQAGDILVNSVHPGWVRTDMGGAAAPLSAGQGADTIVWLATLPPGGPTGGFFEKRERIEW
jgi:NAD(P)-dependent dehydrogenase (short-subunit alcohol dehydrogenase family)